MFDKYTQLLLEDLTGFILTGKDSNLFFVKNAIASYPHLFFTATDQGNNTLFDTLLYLPKTTQSTLHAMHVIHLLSDQGYDLLSIIVRQQNIGRLNDYLNILSVNVRMGLLSKQKMLSLLTQHDILSDLEFYERKDMLNIYVKHLTPLFGIEHTILHLSQQAQKNYSQRMKIMHLQDKDNYPIYWSLMHLALGNRTNQQLCFQLITESQVPLPRQSAWNGKQSWAFGQGLFTLPIENKTPMQLEEAVEINEMILLPPSLRADM